MISVICIHYNDPDMFMDCLKSVDKQLTVEIEHIIIDNSSNFPKEKLDSLTSSYQYIDPGYNSGFARGVNLGLRAAKGEYVLMLNQDAYLPDSDSLNKCLDKLATLPAKTILGVSLVNEEGHYQRSIWSEDPGIRKEWRTSPVHIFFNRRKGDLKLLQNQEELLHQKSGFVHRINGAFLLFSKDLVEKDQLYWDKDFFLYGEDVEWAFRCNQVGWRFYHLSEVKAVHKGSSASVDNISSKQQQVIVSDWLAVRKMRGRFYLLCLLFLTGLNRLLDMAFYYFAVLRKKSTDLQAVNYVKMQLGLLRRFGCSLLSNKSLSGDQSFLINCYTPKKK